MSENRPGELFQRFLREQAAAHAEGLGTTLPSGLVVPFEDTPLRPLDARAAWDDAVAVATTFPGVTVPSKWPVPPDWPGLLPTLDPVADVPFALGHFPQRVRSLTLLLRRRPTPTPPAERPDLRLWAQGQKGASRVLAAGVLRLAGDLDAADELLAGPVRGGVEPLHRNETAALLWQRGEHGRALESWRAQDDTPAVLFNRGLASLFLGERDAARAGLDAARAVLPESSAWHHLASVYRTLAELE